MVFHADSFYEQTFRQHVQDALKHVKKILDTTRNPVIPENIHHKYLDKYILAQATTNSALAALLNCFCHIGLTPDGMKKLKDWVHTQKKGVSLHLSSTETCKFDKKVEREEESPTKYVKESEGVFGKKTTTHKTVTKIVEYFWDFSVTYELFAYSGTNVDDRVLLQQRTGQCKIKTTTDVTPKPKASVVPTMDFDFTWLIQQIAKEGDLSFFIDRSSSKCATPRRNPEIDAAFRFFASLYNWADAVLVYFKERLFPVQQNHELFVPVLPLFEKLTSTEVTAALSGSDQQSVAGVSPSSLITGDSLMLPLSDINRFLQEQQHSISQRFTTLATVFSDSGKLITFHEAYLLVIMLHSRKIIEFWGDSVNYIEALLRKQLIAAIGKEVTPSDFASYMEFHNRKLFRKDFEPRPFCFSIRRPDHYPEGTLSLESESVDGSIGQPVYSVVNSTKATHPMLFKLNAATSVRHQFSGQSGSSMKLVARARQFSSFILLVGRIIGPDQFQPKHAIIVHNKDELLIPLLMETIPTAKEFQDAIESLSPEQQRFAKAFRAMQLESTLFGVAILQIKPQLEVLLKLPEDSLTKEIRLVQDILELFMKYNIPSDLLTYDGDSRRSVVEKVQQVRLYVKDLISMIEEKKKTELVDQAMRAENTILSSVEDRLRTIPPPINLRSRCSAPGGPPPPPPCAPMCVPMCAPSGRGPAPNMGTHKMSAPLPPPPPVLQQSAPPPMPTPTLQKPKQPEQKPKQLDGTPTLEGPEESEVPEGLVDYTKIPSEIDQKFLKLDPESSVRPTIINPGKTWTKSFQKSLLSSKETKTLHKQSIREEREAAFDLLDALTRSGCLSQQEAELHIIISATHCFDKSLLDTLIKDNLNPIEKCERSVLIMATTVHNKPVSELVKTDQIDRVRTYSPMLF